MKRIAVLLASLLFLGSAFAAEIDSGASTFKWSATKKVGAGHNGTIPLKSQTAQFDKKGNLVGGEFVMDLANFDVIDLEGEWKEKFLTHVKSADFFNVEKYPTAKLVITSVKGDKVSGKLTIKEKTNDISFKVKKDKSGYKGTLTFDRTKFDMIYGSGNFFKELTADKVINNDVKVEFSVTVK